MVAHPCNIQEELYSASVLVLRAMVKESRELNSSLGHCTDPTTQGRIREKQELLNADMVKQRETMQDLMQLALSASDWTSVACGMCGKMRL